MGNRVSNSDAVDVEMPPVEEVASVALDSLEPVDEASGLPSSSSSSSVAPNAHAVVSDSVPPDLPPVPPPESPCPEEVHSPERELPIVPVAPSEPAGSDGPVPVGPRGPNVHTTPHSLVSITAPGSSIHLN